MNTRNRLLAVAACAPAALPAMADLPGALDRVPGDTAVVVTVPSIARFDEGMSSLNLPPDVGLQEASEFFHGIEGLNIEGSAALAVLEMDPSADEPPMVAVLPVSDFAGFVGHFGAQAGGGLVELEIEGEPAFAKDLGGGFVALGPVQEFVESFTGEGGNTAAFEALLGPTGVGVVEGAHLSVIANLGPMRPMLEQAMAEGMAQMEMMMQMADPQSAAGMEMVKSLIESGVRDARVGVLGVTVHDAGVNLDFVGGFNEGSEYAGYFTGGGDAHSLVGRIPADPFIFAGAVDLTASGIKTFMTKMAEIQGAAGPGGMMGGLNTAQMLELIDGQAFVMGVPPGGLMGGGMFKNSVAYVASKNPQALAEQIRSVYTTMSGQESGGMKVDFTFEENAQTVNGTPVDGWSMKMEATDPAMAQQMAMSMMMMFGPEGGPSGYMAQTDGGLVMTYAKSTQAMATALAAAASDGALSGNARVARSAEQLPAHRVAEGYLDVNSVWEMVGGMLMMMGVPVGEISLAEDMAPIGIGMTTDSGEARATVFVPGGVIDLIASLAEMGAGMGMDEPGEDAGQPRF